MEDRVGQTIGSYRVIRSLGKGGFAEVYLGEHIHLKRLAAIKLLLTELVTQQELETFLKEAQIIASLDHSNIVHVLDFGITTNTPFMILDYAPNGSLQKQHPKGMRLPLSTIIPYVKQVADALQYAHDQSVIHRDVKPGNMLIGRKNELLLTDFGIALLTQNTSFQKTQSATGTPIYMSPEQIQGKPRFASDQYSLAVVVYEWLAGNPPFRGSWLEIYGQHMHMPPPPLRKSVPELPPEVEEVILIALKKDPEQRFKNIAAFALALEKASRQSTSQSFFSAPTQQVNQQNQTPLSEDDEDALEQLNEPDQKERTKRVATSGAFENVWRDALLAEEAGNEELAFRLLVQLTNMPGLTTVQSELVEQQFRELHQLALLRLKQAREACMQGRWLDEIQAWEDLLKLAPSRDIITRPLILAEDNYGGDIPSRLHIAQQNAQNAWLYAQAQQFIEEQNEAIARKLLEKLWKNAPFYGDVVGLAQRVGLQPKRNYEQVLNDSEREQISQRKML